MEERHGPIRLEDHSLEEIVSALAAGVPVQRAGAAPFRLDTSDKRKAFAFYGRNRDLWRSSRTVQAKEVESLLEALEEDLPAQAALPARGRIDKPVWHLERLEVHRFGGLHRHIGQDGEDPDDLVVELDKEITLVSGFNGAGKTALLSAIVWCLTGKALRSQHMPQEVHEPMAVEWTEAGERALEDGNRPELAVPPLVPIPAGEDLVRLGDRPRLDTSVRLTFRRESDGEIRHVTRRLRMSGRKLGAPVEGLDALGLSALAIEAGTLMPGVAAQMRFDERTDLAQAVSQLTGLKPLQELGQRSVRLVNRLRKTERGAAEERRDGKLGQFRTHLETFLDGWAERSDLGSPPEILLPGEEVESRQEGSGSTCRATCHSTLSACRKRLRRAGAAMSRDAGQVLGREIEITERSEVVSLTRALDEAAGRLRGSDLRELPTVALLIELGKVPDDDAASAMETVRGIRERAHALAGSWRMNGRRPGGVLYARVAAWHRDNHPDEDLSSCPVAGLTLKACPETPARHFREGGSRTVPGNRQRHLEDGIRMGAGRGGRSLDALPASVRGHADRTSPGTLLAMCRMGYVEELLGHEAFSGTLSKLREAGEAVWDIAVSENGLPEAPGPVQVDLPVLLAGGRLQERLSAISHALMLRAHRKRGGDALKGILDRYIGSVAPTGEGAEPVSAGGPSREGRKTWRPEEAALREQIETVRRAVQNALPIVSLARQLEALETVRQEWDAQAARLLLLDRAAAAVEPYLGLPELVHERVSGLIRSLDRDTAEWLGRIYRPHYLGGPSYGGFEPEEGSRFGMRAGIGDLRVPAHQVMNASLLRACVWAFLFAFWEHVRRHAGCVSCVLLDDLQTHFDPMNSENLAAVVPRMPECGMRPLIVSNDVRFVASIQGQAAIVAGGQAGLERVAARPDILIEAHRHSQPCMEEIRERRDRWKEDQNNVRKAQDFVKSVRVDMESRLWNLLATDPLVLHAPTLGDLLGRLRHARNGGERPFDERPFGKLLSHRALRDTEPFYRTISKAHHRPTEITPQDAADVCDAYEDVHGILRGCSASYARFLGRLEREDHAILLADMPPAPAIASLSGSRISVLGRLAARSGSDVLAAADDAEVLEMDTLGPVAMYAVRASTLGLVALPGQVAIVALEREASPGDAVVALHGGTAYARRFHKDRRDLSRTILTADSSGSANVPPMMAVDSAATRVMPVIGVLYDERRVPRPGRGRRRQLVGNP